MKLLVVLKNKFIEIYDRINNAAPSWTNRAYDFYLIFGQTEESKSPWITANWKSDYEPYFNKLLEQVEESKNTGIRALKYKLEKKTTKKDAKEFTYHVEVKLGRLKWDQKSYEKWTINNNVENYFSSFELWNPIWTICEKIQSPPDIYIYISNERRFESKRDIKFGFFIVVAVAKNLKINSKNILMELSEKTNPKATISKTRRWEPPEKCGNWTFSNWIQDTFTNGIYKSTDLHNFKFNELEFEPFFEILYREK